MKKSLKEFDELPYMIKEQQLKVSANEDRIKELVQKMKSRETAIMLDVVQEVDNEQKPIFKNAQSREAETQTRVNTDPAIQKMQTEISKVSLELREDKAEFEYLCRRWSTLKHKLIFLTNNLKVLNDSAIEMFGGKDDE